MRARFTQASVHSTSQQRGSARQTVLQQSVSLQAAVPFATQQSPSPGHAQAPGLQSTMAAFAQSIVHSSRQHSGVVEHTKLQQSTSSHPHVPLATQQLPFPGQSPLPSAAFPSATRWP